MSEFRPCNECKDWDNCLLTEDEKDWFGYHHIRYCPQQVFWLLKYDDIIRGHRWPVADDTALGGMGGQTLSEATFTKVSRILAELDGRLEKTGDKGDILREQCKNRDRVQYLSDKAKDALYYVVGDNPKSTSFVDWLRIRRFRYENRNRVKIR